MQRALRETVRQLNDLRDAVGERFGEELADVFTTHIMILEDQGFRDRLRRRVERARQRRARAGRDACRATRRSSPRRADATVRERAADLEDVLQRAVGELLGVRLHNPPLRHGVIVVAERIAPSEFVLLETEKIAGHRDGARRTDEPLGDLRALARDPGGVAACRASPRACGPRTS